MFVSSSDFCMNRTTTCFIMPPAPNRRGIKRCFCLTCVRLTSVAYIGPKSRTERPRKTKIGTKAAHVTRDSDTTFRVKRSRSPCRFGWLFKSLYVTYIDENSLRHHPERAAACRSWIFMKQGALQGAAGVIVHEPGHFWVSSEWANSGCYFPFPLYVHIIYCYDNLCRGVA